jgi:hypothetical protein
MEDKLNTNALFFFQTTTNFTCTILRSTKVGCMHRRGHHMICDQTVTISGAADETDKQPENNFLRWQRIDLFLISLHQGQNSMIDNLEPLRK